MSTFADLVAYRESHLADLQTFPKPATERYALCETSWPSLAVIDSGDCDFAARVPAQSSPAVAPIDLVPNQSSVNDDTGAVSVISPQQDGIADHRFPRMAPDDHALLPPMRCLISATNL
jgi:hypothetical protein